MDILNQKFIHVKDGERVNRIVTQLINGGPSKLQVISDFDHTLSRVHRNGHQCATTYGILMLNSLTNENYRKEVNALYDEYHPIESDSKLSKAQKAPYMREWTEKNLKLLPKAGLCRANIEDLVKLSNVELRDRCDSFLSSLEEQGIPLLVFSAGIGDIVKEVLHQSGLFYPNVKIIANFLEFDEKENLIGFKGNRSINSFNKNDSSRDSSYYFECLQSRKNVVLLGDSLGDVDMAKDMQDVDSILKIGFLDKKVKENLEAYKDVFDVVIIDDQSMDIVNGLTQSIINVSI